ncbi:unnamed protein product [Caretta caretta]
METDQNKPFAKGAASWSWERRQFLVNLWCKASKTVDFSKSIRNDYTYQQIVKKLAALEIYQTGDQCREWIKWLKKLQLIKTLLTLAGLNIVIREQNLVS